MLNLKKIKQNENFCLNFHRMLKDLFGNSKYWGSITNKELNYTTKEGVLLFHSFTEYSNKYKIPKSDWSVLNFFSTNNAVLEKLLEHFNKDINFPVKTTHNFLDFIRKFIIENKKGDKLKELVNINFSMIELCTEKEFCVFHDIKSFFKLDTEFNFYPGGKKDMLDGTDLIFKNPNGKLTLQVKKIFGHKTQNDSYKISLKSFPENGYSTSLVNYLAFVNNQNQILYFPNDGEITVESNLISQKGNNYCTVELFSSPLKVSELEFK